MRLFPPTSLAIATIWQEARGEPRDGKVAVGEVIRNRMAARYMSDGTIEDTCLRPYQFSGWNANDPNRIPAVRLDDTNPMVNECVAAWIASATSTLTFGAVHYLNPAIVHPLPAWADPALRTAIIGRHHFFRKA